MTPVLHVVSQCTDRKKQPVPDETRLRHFTPTNSTLRAQKWLSVLATSTNRVPARALYAGEHWAETLELETLAENQGFDSRLWVASAGYGLINGDDTVRPYSATFSTNADDTVVRAEGDVAEQRRDWFRMVSGRRADDFVDSVRTSAQARVLCILSPSYVQAMLPLLTSIRAALAKPEHLLVVTSRCSEAEIELKSSWVPSSARLAHVVGGSRIGQHVRLAKALVAAVGVDVNASAWRDLANQWTESTPSLTRYNRAPMSDDEVIQFAREVDASSWSRALRSLRAGGRACEQKRFRQLFMEARGA